VFAEVRAATVSFISGNLTSTISVMQDPGEEQYWASTDVDTLLIGQTGGAGTIAITSNTSWTITTPTWVTYCSVTSGTGDTTLVFMTDVNNTLFERIGDIAIMREGVVLARVVLVQEGIYSVLDPGITEINMPAEGGSYTFHLTANQAWSIHCDVAWVSCSPSEGNGNQAVLVKALAWSSTEPRETTIVITGSYGNSVSILVRQSN